MKVNGQGMIQAQRRRVVIFRHSGEWEGNFRALNPTEREGAQNPERALKPNRGPETFLGSPERK